MLAEPIFLTQMRTALREMQAAKEAIETGRFATARESVMHAAEQLNGAVDKVVLLIAQEEQEERDKQAARMFRAERARIAAKDAETAEFAPELVKADDAARRMNTEQRLGDARAACHNIDRAFHARAVLDPEKHGTQIGELFDAVRCLARHLAQVAKIVQTGDSIPLAETHSR